MRWVVVAFPIGAKRKFPTENQCFVPRSCFFFRGFGAGLQTALPVTNACRLEGEAPVCKKANLIFSRIFGYFQELARFFKNDKIPLGGGLARTRGRGFCLASADCCCQRATRRLPDVARAQRRKQSAQRAAGSNFVKRISGERKFQIRS